MDRLLFQDGACFTPGETTLLVKFVAGSSGAVPTDLADYLIASGIESMTLAATGKYKVNLSDAYCYLAPGTDMKVMQGTYDASHGCRGEVNAEDVDSPTAPYVEFQCVRNDTGAAVAVTEGDTVLIKLVLGRLEVQG